MKTYKVRLMAFGKPGEIREVDVPEDRLGTHPTKLDILSCRNLLIYLAPEMQKKLIPLFHYSLSPGGILFLGSAESVGKFTDLFVPLGGKSRLFRHAANVRGEPVEFPSSFSATPLNPRARPSRISHAILKAASS